MEKFFLCTFFTADKLNIVHKQNIRLSVFLSEFIHLGKTERLNKLNGKIVAFYVTDNF